jgi:hypothetical protein
MGQSTKRPGAAGTARVMAQEVVAPMQAQRNAVVSWMWVPSWHPSVGGSGVPEHWITGLARDALVAGGPVKAVRHIGVQLRRRRQMRHCRDMELLGRPGDWYGLGCKIGSDYAKASKRNVWVPIMAGESWNARAERHGGDA